MSGISMPTLRRLPGYLGVLKQLEHQNERHVSSSALAKELGLVDVQVRKDLASVSKGGKPRVGYVISELRQDIEQALGYNNVNSAVLVGAGKLGKALLSYRGFEEYGLNIVAAFDTEEALLGKDPSSDKHVFPLSKMKDLCRRMQIHIGIITTPASCAQEVCDLLVASGVEAIWNFAPVHLKAPRNILIKTENLVVSLAELSQHLMETKTHSQEATVDADTLYA